MRICLKPIEGSSRSPSIGGVHECLVNLQREFIKLGHTISDEYSADVVHGHAFDAGRDVYTSHGVYPEVNAHEVESNRSLFNNIVGAKRVTAVSEWTAKQFSHLGVDTHIIHNGVDYDKLQSFKQSTFGARDYVIWAKAAADYVRNPMAYLKLASQRPDLKFWMTIAPQDSRKSPNIKMIGLRPHEDCLRVISKASVYVSTGVENFSIQILEAMALGIPVLAVNKGGVSEVDGIVKVDEDGLMDGLEYCLSHRDEIIKRQDEIVKGQFTWEIIAKQYVKMFEEVRKEKPHKTKVSIVIPCYNYAETIVGAVESCLNQSVAPDEIIVVDDGSKDNTEEVLKPYSKRIKYIKQKNAGVSAARNHGIEKASGDYIICLDADDQISPGLLETGKNILDRNPSVGIAYPGMEIVADGEFKGDLPPNPFDFEQLTKGNFIPCANVFRKEAWKKAGGYKDINPSWEDYDMWLSICELGYTAVDMNDQRLLYNVHNKGRTAEAEGGQYAGLLRATVDGYHRRIYGGAGLVTVVIPCYNQWQYVKEAVKSAFDQSYPHIEVIVVDDASTEYGIFSAALLSLQFPKVKIFQRASNGGLAAARNTGIELSKGEWIVPLDADDKLHPDFVRNCIKRVYNDEKYAYTDVLIWHNQGKGPEELWEAPEYDCARIYDEHLHACTILVKKKWLTHIGMYDANMRDGWEDLEMVLRLARNGMTGVKVPGPLFYYRWREDGMRLSIENDPSKKKAINDYIWSKHKDLTREALMACCGNPIKSKVVTVESPDELSMALNTPEGATLMKYNGHKVGQMTKRGSHGRLYRYDATSNLFYVGSEDTALFSGNLFSHIRKPLPVTEAEVQMAMKPPVENPVDEMPDGDDDLMILEGITQEQSDALKAAGLTTFKKLIAADIEVVVAILGKKAIASKFRKMALAVIRDQAGA